MNIQLPAFHCFEAFGVGSRIGTRPHLRASRVIVAFYSLRAFDWPCQLLNCRKYWKNVDLIRDISNSQLWGPYYFYISDKYGSKEVFQWNEMPLQDCHWLVSRRKQKREQQYTSMDAQRLAERHPKLQSGCSTLWDSKFEKALLVTLLLDLTTRQLICIDIVKELYMNCQTCQVKLYLNWLYVCWIFIFGLFKQLLGKASRSLTCVLVKGAGRGQR